jgi:signal transduction histidine kinase
MTSNTLDEIRSISRALFPPMLKKLGLSKSIKQTLFELDEETELFISSEVDHEIDTAFNEDETLNFFRFIQEGVNNVVKHSKASTLEVTISKEKDKVKALIRDNGVGFDDIQKLTQNSLGLKTMTERIKTLGGKLSIKSQAGEGTWLLAEINT